MTFTDLPVDCLTALASFVSEPNVIVAVGSSKDARAALRRGVDIAERARFGLTVREASVAAAKAVPPSELRELAIFNAASLAFACIFPPYAIAWAVALGSSRGLSMVSPLLSRWHCITSTV